MSEDDPENGRPDEPNGERAPDVERAPDGERVADASGDGDAEETPFSELASDVRERRERESDRELEELFSEVEVEDVDGEQAWRELLAEEEGEPLAVGERVETEEDRDVRVIDNRTCHRCQYFGDPPELHCTHEGTEIRRVVDTDHYEVVDCPMVVDEEEFTVTDSE